MVKQGSFGCNRAGDVQHIAPHNESPTKPSTIVAYVLSHRTTSPRTVNPATATAHHAALPQ